MKAVEAKPEDDLRILPTDDKKTVNMKKKKVCNDYALNIVIYDSEGKGSQRRERILQKQAKCLATIPEPYPTKEETISC